jgi:hypothetical protein
VTESNPLVSTLPLGKSKRQGQKQEKDKEHAPQDGESWENSGTLDQCGDDRGRNQGGYAESKDGQAHSKSTTIWEPLRHGGDGAPVEDAYAGSGNATVEDGEKPDVWR